MQAYIYNTIEQCKNIEDLPSIVRTLTQNVIHDRSVSPAEQLVMIDNINNLSFMKQLQHRLGNLSDSIPQEIYDKYIFITLASICATIVAFAAARSYFSKNAMAAQSAAEVIQRQENDAANYSPPSWLTKLGYGLGCFLIGVLGHTLFCFMKIQAQAQSPQSSLEI